MAIPDLIEIVRQGDVCHVFIDGRELPGSIPRDADALVVKVDPDELPTITVRLQAHRVQVVNDVADGARPPTLEKERSNGAQKAATG